MSRLDCPRPARRALARMTAENVVTADLEWNRGQTFIKFGYDVGSNGEWVGSHGRTLDQMRADSLRDSAKLGLNDDHVFERLIAVQDVFRADPNQKCAIVVSEDLGSGRSYIYLYQRNPDGNGITAFAIDKRIRVRVLETPDPGIPRTTPNSIESSKHSAEHSRQAARTTARSRTARRSSGRSAAKVRYISPM